MALEERNPVLDEIRERFALKTLEERCWRLESENKDLKTHNSILHTQYTSQRETQSDILRQLNQTIEETVDKLDSAENKILTLEDQLADQKQLAEDHLEEERHQWESKVLGLKTQCEELKNTLNEVREFQKQKDFMEGELERLKHDLVNQKEDHERKVSEFDRKKAMEIDQLKQDMHRSIRETREMLRAKTKDQLDQTTKRTMIENEQKTTELQFQNKEAERLLKDNNKLLEENAQLRRNLVIHKDLENELAKRTHVYQKLLKKMEQKQKSELAAKEQSKELRTVDSLDLESTRAEYSHEQATTSLQLSAEFETTRRHLEKEMATLAQVRYEFGQYKKDHATLTQLQDQTTRFIISAIYELKHQRESGPFPPPGYDESADWQFATMTAKQKEYFFRALLEKLNSSMCGKCFPAGPSLDGSPSTTSLPAIHKPQHSASGELLGQSHFSQFLWSVATHGGQASLQFPSGRETTSKSVQTETSDADPCLQEGLWNPMSRKHFANTGSVTPAMVTSTVRSWGSHSTSHRVTGRVASRLK